MLDAARALCALQHKDEFMRTWSKYQQDVFDFLADGKGHGVVNARAGSGKSTTLEECCRVVGNKRVLVIAFNRRIADAMQSRVPRNASARTLHAFGRRAIYSAWGTAPVDEDKEDGIARIVMGEDTVKKFAASGAVTSLCRLVSMAKAWLVFDAAHLEQLAVEYDCEPPLGISIDVWVAWAQRVLEESKKPGSVSYDDMIWLPVVLEMRVDTYDFVFVDETQDLNRAQVELALKAVRNTGRILAVGDPAQAIYGFRGADSESMAYVTGALDAVTMPLSITYRCPRSVVKEAQQFVPDFEAAPDAKEGRVSHCQEEELLRNAVAGDAVISRKNAPLVRLCLSFLRDGQRAAVVGRDIGASLNALVRRSKTDSISEFSTWLEDYGSRERTRLLARKQERKLEELHDKIATLDCLADGCSSVRELSLRISSLFDDKGDDKSRIVLSSTHKAKGLEWERVWMLSDTYSRRSQEEENLCYVATTRSMNELCKVHGKET